MVGFADAGFDPQFAANHMAAAIDTVRRNFPAVRYERCDINNLDFRHIPRTRVLVGCPICKEVAPAGGNSTASQKPVTGQAPAADGRAPAPAWSRTRATAWDLIRANEVHDYDMVCGENVPDFVTRWALFEAWANVWAAPQALVGPHTVPGAGPRDRRGGEGGALATHPHPTPQHHSP
ncbi:hypothetical protein ACFV5D_30525, partial [Streptomyces clavifer]